MLARAVDRVLVVDCDEALQVERDGTLGWTREAVQARAGAASRAPRRAGADAVIDNDGPLARGTVSRGALCLEGWRAHPCETMNCSLPRTGAGPGIELRSLRVPFNESIRTMLRLEHLFDRLGPVDRTRSAGRPPRRSRRSSRSWTSPRAPTSVRPAQRSERQKAQFNGFRQPVDLGGGARRGAGPRRPCLQRLNHLPAGRRRTHGNEWLMSIRSRISIPGTCEFDLPGY